MKHGIMFEHKGRRQRGVYEFAQEELFIMFKVKEEQVIFDMETSVGAIP